MGRTIALAAFLILVALLVWAGMDQDGPETAVEPAPAPEATVEVEETTEATQSPETTVYDELPDTSGERR